MKEKAPRQSHTVFLAIAKPTMYAGVTVEAFVFNIILTAFIFMVGGLFIKHASFLIVLGLFIHLVFRLICKYDANAFRILMAAIKTRAPLYANKYYWGGYSLSPLRFETSENSSQMRKIKAGRAFG